MIATAWKVLRRDGRELLGFDDAQALAVSGGILVVNLDVFDESTDWLPGMTLREVGWRSVIAAVSDVLVKGARPLGLMLGLGVPDSVAESIEELFVGIQEACDTYGVRVWGGDLGSSDHLYLAVTAIGIAERVVARRGARPGECVMITGPVGFTPVVYGVLLDGSRMCRGFREAIEVAYRPRLVDPEFWLAACKYATAAIDNSDGLALTLHYLAESSGVKLVIEDLPLTECLVECAGEWGVDPVEMALYMSGEEYSFIFTVKPGNVREVAALAEKYGVEVHRIGRVEEGCGVYMKGLGRVEKRGWLHFKGWASAELED